MKRMVMLLTVGALFVALTARRVRPPISGNFRTLVTRLFQTVSNSSTLAI